MNHSNPGINFFGITNFRNHIQKFGIKEADRDRHMYIIGKTGTGKTTLIENMIMQDILNGNGVAFLDPHGESAMRILEYIPPHRINDVIYFNPSDTEYPIAFNFLECTNPSQKHLVAAGLMSVFKKLWEDQWSARMEYIMNNTLLALLDSPGNTLLGINRIYSDKNFRKKIVGRVTDPIVRTFWVNEYATYKEQYRIEATAAIQNKIGQLMSSSIIRNITGQTKSTIDIRDIMDNGKILIMNLSKGLIGDDNSNLLGAMMVVKLQLAAMSRIDIPTIEDRRPFYLYVDEFQNFAVSSFAEILAEARKYKLCLILAHQYLAQLEDNIKDAVFGNVGTLITFRVGAPDAAELLKEFEPYFTEENLINIERRQIYLKLMIDGMMSKPFSAGTMPPIYATLHKDPETKEKVIRVSRERYAKPRSMVEEKILKWSNFSEEESGGIPEENSTTEPATLPKKSAPAPAKPVLYTLLCDSCTQPVPITFEPSSEKPILCRDCLKKHRSGELSGEALRSKNEEFFQQQQQRITNKKIDLANPLEQIRILSSNEETAQDADGYIPLSELRERLKNTHSNP